jgi:hypothetical protein
LISGTAIKSEFTSAPYWRFGNALSPRLSLE